MQKNMPSASRKATPSFGNDSLCKEVNEALHTLKKNGTFDKLAEKYELSDMVCLKN